MNGSIRVRRSALAVLALALTLAPTLAIAPTPARAEDRLTLADAVARALGAYPAVTAARARGAEARAALGEARSDFGPQITAGLAAARYGEPVPVTPIHGFRPDQLPEFDRTLVQGTLQLGYTLFDAGGRRQKVRQADAQVAAAGAELGAAEQATAARVATLFAAVLARGRTLDAQAARGSALDAERARVEQLLAVGRAAEVDRLRAEAAAAAAEAERIRAATALDSAERDLARLLGAAPDETRLARLVPLSPPAGEPDPRERLAGRAAAASPEVAAARAAVAAAEATRALARTGWFPKLRATGAWQELGAAELDFSSEWNAGLSLGVTVWDGGATARRVARAAAALDGARARLAEAELDARAAVDRALAALAEAHARSAALGRAEERLTEVARIQKLLLEVGSGTQIDYLAAESDLAATRAALAESASAELVARVELARAVGELSPAWIAENLETVR